LAILDHVAEEIRQRIAHTDDHNRQHDVGDLGPEIQPGIRVVQHASESPDCHKPKEATGEKHREHRRHRQREPRTHLSVPPPPVDELFENAESTEHGDRDENFPGVRPNHVDHPDNASKQFCRHRLLTTHHP